MADQDLIIYDGELELTGEFKFDVGHSSWSNPIELFSEAEPIEKISATFDQLGRPIVFYRLTDNTLKLWWFDSLAGQTVTTILGYGSDPVASFDYPIDINREFTDVLLHYVRKNKLYMRVQRDRFAVEYPVHPNQAETVAYLQFTDGFKDQTGEPWITDGAVALMPEGFFGQGANFTAGSLIATTSPDWAFGTSDFTLGMRIYPDWIQSGDTTLLPICGNWSFNLGSTGWGLFGRPDGALVFKLNSHTTTSAPGILPFNGWSMVEVSRSGGDIRIFVQGETKATASGATANVTVTRAIQIAKDIDSGAYNTFKLDSFFVIKGLAQRTTDYSVPSTPQKLWVSSNMQSINGLVFAADLRTSLKPWVAESEWTTIGRCSKRYVPSLKTNFVDFSHAKQLNGLESTGAIEQLKIGTLDFSIKIDYYKSNQNPTGYDDEVLLTYLTADKSNGFEVGVIDKVYPYFRSWTAGVPTTIQSPVIAAIESKISLLITRTAGSLKIWTNGILRHTEAHTVDYTDNKKMSVGYRVYTETRDTTSNALAGHSQFLGFISAIEVYSNLVIASDRQLLQHPNTLTTATTGDGLGIISAGARSDYRFQVAYRRMIPEKNIAFSRYLSKGVEYLKLTNTKLAVTPTNFKIAFNIDRFDHFDINANPLILFGDSNPNATMNQVSYANDGAPVYFEIPATFAVALVPKLTPTSPSSIGGKTLTRNPNLCLVVSCGATVQTVNIQSEFGPGYWEFVFIADTLTIFKNGIDIGTNGGGLPVTPNVAEYGLFFSKNKNATTLNAARSVICSQVELTGALLDSGDLVSSNTETFDLTSSGALYFDSSNGSRLTFVNGDGKRWI